MKYSYSRYVQRASVVAVQSALAALAMAQMAAAADEVSEEVRELTERSSFVEAGAGYVNKGAFKFGEYNGLQNKGAYGIGGFEINGGEQDSAFRWQARGTDLGLETRSLGVEVGVQGKYRFNYSYDELRRNASDNFSTPFQGSGTRSLTLPSNYPAPATRGSAGLSSWNNIQAPYATGANILGTGPAFVIPAAMRQVDIDTKRERHDVGLSWILGSNWDFKTSFRHEDKEGTKLTGISFGSTSRGALLPEPVSNSTDQFNASLAYKTENGHFTVGYYGSIFRNDINRWTADNPFANSAVLNNLAVMSGAPDNQMHQLNLAGAYNLSKATRLVVAGSYARMTQDEAFHYQSGAGWQVPVSSANAKVINTNFNARLTSRATNELTVNTAYKFEDRNNKTPIRTFLVAGADGTGAASLFTNEPINRRLQQVNLDADYRLGRGQAVKGGYEWQEIKRTADGDETPFRAEKTREQTIKVEYRNSLNESVNGRIAYAYSQRRSSHYEPGDPAPTDPAAPLPAADPLLPDFKQFFLADRNRDKLRTSADFQATNALSFQAGLDYNRDNFNNSPNGLTETNSWVFNLDGAYAASETLSFNAYYTYEDLKSRLESRAIPRVKSTSTLVAHVACAPYTNVSGNFPADYLTDPCRQWSETQADHVHTVGLGAKATDLLAGKLELTGNVAYSHARTPISMTGGAYYNNGVTNSATGNGFIAAQSFPDITSNVLDFRLTGKYVIDKTSAVRLSYLYRRLRSSDFQYDAFSNVLAMQGYIGTGQTSPNYEVQAMGVSYIYTFR